MSTSLYYPLLLFGLGYAGLVITAGIVSRRGDHERGERLMDMAFGAALVAAAYTLTLLILSALDAPGRFTDAITIMLVIVGFFALLLVFLFGVSQAYARIRGRTGS